MTSDYFGPLVEIPHPKVEALTAWKASQIGVSVVNVELYWEPPYHASVVPKVIIRLLDMDGKLVDFKEELTWDMVLESWLTVERARSMTFASEVIRTHVLLQEAFRPILREVGSGGFYDILLKELQDGPLKDHEVVRGVIRSLRPARLRVESENSRHEALQIVEAFKTVTARLSGLYPGDRSSVEELLASGVASLIQERYARPYVRPGVRA